MDRIVLLIFLGLVTGCYVDAQSDQSACALNVSVVDQVTAKQNEDLRCLAVPGQNGLYVISWTAGIIDRPSAHLRLVRITRGAAKVTQALDIGDGFSQEIEFTRQYRDAGGPLLTVLTRFGAAAVEVRIITVQKEVFRILLKVFADDITTASLGNATVLVAHNTLNGMDVPDLYRYEAGKFVKSNLRYPDYYRRLLLGQNLTAESMVADDLAPQLARLLYLSGDRKGAARVMERHRGK